VRDFVTEYLAPIALIPELPTTRSAEAMLHAHLQTARYALLNDVDEKEKPMMAVGYRIIVEGYVVG
jgi:hypothetical protein